VGLSLQLKRGRWHKLRPTEEHRVLEEEEEEEQEQEYQEPEEEQEQEEPEE